MQNKLNRSLLVAAFLVACQMQAMENAKTVVTNVASQVKTTATNAYNSEAANHAAKIGGLVVAGVVTYQVAKNVPAYACWAKCKTVNAAKSAQTTVSSWFERAKPKSDTNAPAVKSTESKQAAEDTSSKTASKTLPAASSSSAATANS